MAPNAMLPALTLRAAVAAFNCRERDFEVPPDEAVRDAVVEVLTAEILAENVAEFAVAGTDMELGTATEALLLARATLTPPEGAEPDREMVQASANAPVMEVLPQVNPATVGTTVEPVPLRLTAAVDTLLLIESWPATEPAVVGLN